MPADIVNVSLKVGLEIHVELSARTKMFSAAPSPACAEHMDAAPNTLIDPTVLGLPGALPVMNKAAIEMAMMVGLALNCEIARETKWDRKSYFYPDLPKAYQISQYDLPLCFDGSVELPALAADGFPDFSQAPRSIGIIRAHLEEDAGKLLHEAPGGAPIDFTIADYNRAGTALLEIVTQPDFTSAEQVVLFARLLRQTCRFLGVTQGIMQRGHMRFEPNINCILTLADGHTAVTPIVEVKNLNSFRSVKGAIEFELADQPRRWQQDGRVSGPGTKITRGWDDAREITFLQREKEDAHDYRYFPDPDLLPVRIDEAWRSRVEGSIPELPLARQRRYAEEFSIPSRDAAAIVEERATCELFEAITDNLVQLSVDRERSGKLAANLLLQHAAKRANESGQAIHDLGINPFRAAAIARLREEGLLNNQALESLFDLVLAPTDPADTPQSALQWARSAAADKGLLVVRDDAAMDGWIAAVFAANPKVVEDVKSGKVQAAGRLVGEVMKLAAGKADAKTVREEILKRLGVG